MRRATVLVTTLGLGLLVVAAAASDSPTAAATNHVSRASALLLEEHPTDAQLREGFLSLLDALLLVAPEGGAQAAWPAKAAEARRLIDAGSLVDRRAASLLGDCYRATHGGEAFRMPATVHSIADARAYIGRQLATVPDLLKAGHGDEAVQRLLEAAVAIVTPMHR
jgi:hypothetical protein